MQEDTSRDQSLTHSIINYLQAGYQGLFTYYNVLARLEAKGRSDEQLAKVKDVLLKADSWSTSMAKGICLFSAKWESPKTFEAQNALRLLDDLRNSLITAARQSAEGLTAPDLQSDEEKIRLLLALLARYSYSRENYIRGALTFARQQGLEKIHAQYTEYLPAAGDDIKVVHELLRILQTNSLQPVPDFIAALRYQCLRLPGAFRSQAHDINQLLLMYRGGITYAAAEIAESQAAQWQQLGVPPAQAGYWAAHDISPEEAVAWHNAGAGNHDSASAWRLHGFSPQNASQWIVAGFPPAAALSWAQSGHTPESAIEAIKNQQQEIKLKDLATKRDARDLAKKDEPPNE